MSQGRVSLSWSSLPQDIARMVIVDWIMGSDLEALSDLETLSNLDVAFCNHELRPLLLEWIKRCPLELSWPLAVDNIGVNRHVFLRWLMSRDFRVRNLSIFDVEGNGACEVHVLDGLLFMNPVVFSSLEELRINDRATDGAVMQSLQNIVKSLPTLTSLSCCLYPLDEYLGFLQSLPQSLSELTVTAQSASVMFLRAHESMTNLTHLTLNSLGGIDGPGLLTLLGKLSLLEMLSVHATKLKGQIPPESAWSASPLLVKLDHLFLERLPDSPGNSLISYLLDRSPNLTQLEMEDVEVHTTTLPRLMHTLSKLSMLRYSSKKSTFRVLVTAKPGERFENIEPTEVSNPALTSDVTVGLHIMYALRQARTETVECDFSGPYLRADAVEVVQVPPCVTALVRDCQQITVLRFHDVALPLDPYLWRNVFALPRLQVLSVVKCQPAGVAVFVEALKWCRNAGRVASTVIKFTLTTKKEQDLFLAPDLIVQIFPSVQRLEMTALISDADFIWMVLQLKHLRNVFVRCHDQLTLRDISNEQWQQLDRRVKFVFNDAAPACWPHVKRMVNALGSRLRRVVIDQDSLHSQSWRTLLDQEVEEAYVEAHRHILTID